MALQSKDFSLTAKSGSGKITYTYILRVTENSIDPVKNSSNVTVEAILKQTYSGVAFSGYRTGVSCTVNAETLFSDYCRRTIEGREEHVFYTWQGELPHGDDGKLTISVSGRLWQTKPAEYTPPAMDIPEESMELTPIARASQVGVADGVIEGRTTVVITPANPGFTHTLQYTFCQDTGYICQDGSISSEPVMLTGTTVSFELPKSFYYQIPDKAWAYCTLTCTTYSGDVCVGTRQSTFRVNTDQLRCWPIARFSTEDVNPDTLALTGDPERLIRHMSCLRVTLEAQGAHGAWITRRTVNGQELTEAYLDIPEVQSSEVQAVAVDSRGHRIVLDAAMQMIPYVKLTNHAAVSRTEPATGRAVLTFSGNCYKGSLGKVSNSLLLRCRICPEGGEFGPWQEIQAIVRDDHTYRLEMELSDLDYTKTYTLQTQAKDLLDEAQSDLTVMPGVPAFHWKKDRFFFHVPVQCDASLSGAYIRSHTLQNADGITLSVEPGQTVFLLGADGLVCGAVGSGGSWWGSQPVTVQSEQGRVRLLFSESCSGEFLLMSARQFSIE